MTTTTGRRAPWAATRGNVDMARADIEAAIAAAPATKRGDELAVGDVIRCLAEDHMITSIKPYGPSNLDFIDDRWRVAHSGDWGMTLDPDHLWALLPNGVWIGAHRYTHELTRQGRRP